MEGNVNRSSKVSERMRKKRAVVSYANMSPELAAAFKEKYPRGYADYMGDIFKVEKPDGSFFYAISLEIPDAIYLIKIDVKIDNYEEAESSLFADPAVAGDETADDATFPDDDSAGAFAVADDTDSDE